MLKSVNNLSDFSKVNNLAWTGEEVKEEITWTPFHEAASSRSNGILSYFIRTGVPVDLTLDLDCLDPGFTALHYAAQRNNLQGARILLRNGASVSSMIEGICDPIHLAVFYGHVEMVTLLLDHGAEVNLRFNNKFFRENKDYLGDVDFLGEKMHETLWLDHNITLLHCSILRKFDDLTKLLLDRGADIDLKTSLEKTTLMQAIEVNNNKLVKYLVNEKNANVDDRDIFGKPVIHFLMLNANRLKSKYSKIEYEEGFQKSEILQILILKHVNLDINFPEDGEYTNVIHYMIRYGFYRLARTILYFTDFAVLNQYDFNLGQLCKLNPEYLTPDIENDFNYLQTLQSSFERTAYFFLEFAVSKQIIGIPYDKKLITTYAMFEWMTDERFARDLEDIVIKVNAEINFIKQTPIGDSNVTVYKLLKSTEEQLAKLAADESLNLFNITLDFMETNKLRYYLWIVKVRIVYSTWRIQYLKQCTELLSGYWFRNQLPLDCCEKIASYFDDLTIDESEFKYLPRDDKS